MYFILGGFFLILLSDVFCGKLTKHKLFDKTTSCTVNDARRQFDFLPHLHIDSCSFDLESFTAYRLIITLIKERTAVAGL